MTNNILTCNNSTQISKIMTTCIFNIGYKIK